MTAIAADRPALYVGTFAKYNNGSLSGKWMYLDDYTDSDDFIVACKELHKDEYDPELMFQDFEGFPRSYYSESHVNPKIWEWIDMDDDDKEILEAYHEGVDETGTLEQARDAFAGTADSEADFAEEYLESTGVLDEVPENLRYHIDFKSYARDMEMTFVWHNGTLYAFYN